MRIGRILNVRARRRMDVAMRRTLPAFALAAPLAACAPLVQESMGPGLAGGGLPVEVRNDNQDPMTVYATPGRVRLGQVPPKQARTFTIPPAAVSDRTRIMVCQGGTANPASRCATTRQAIQPGMYATEAVRVDQSTTLFVELAAGRRR